MINKKTTKAGRILRILYQSQNQWVSNKYMSNRINFNEKKVGHILRDLKREKLVRRNPLKNIYNTKPYWKLSPRGMKLMNWIRDQGEL